MAWIYMEYKKFFGSYSGTKPSTRGAPPFKTAFWGLTFQRVEGVRYLLQLGVEKVKEPVPTLAPL